jgi:hypothetical protein
MSTAGEISGTGQRGYYRETRTHVRHEMDFYIEPRWAVDLFLDAENMPGPVWDPACGSGTIPTSCQARGILAAGTDAADRGFGPVHDFLGMEPSPMLAGVASIITNPPYKLAQQFVERALTIATRKVAVLVQSKFPYSQGRHRLFTANPTSKVYFLSDRPSMPPGEKLLAGNVKPEGGKMDYCWIVFEHGHRGPPTAHWLTRRKAA